jgi:acyl-CoA reductase-like NAD-dependent aldehyde dehydrogenase
MVVMFDADLDLAVDALMRAAYGAAGSAGRAVVAENRKRRGGTWT